MFKHSMDIQPPYITRMFSLVSSKHNISTRSSIKYFCNFPRTKFYQETIRFKGPSIFNNVPHDIASVKSFSSFKCKYRAHLIAHID